MDDRDLMINRKKISRFKLLKLPAWLQYKIVEGLDTRTLSLAGAVELAKSAGYSIADTSISRYYQCLRKERRRFLLDLERERRESS
jgi:hypothetical protein